MIAELAIAALVTPAAGLEAIQVRGNERTEEAVILRAAGVTVGDPVTAGDLPAIRQRLMNLRLFGDVEVTLPAGHDVLTIEVDERWTLIPLPMLMVAGDDFRVGGLLLEANLFGLNKKLGAGGAYQEDSSMAFLMYEDPSILGSRLVGSARFQLFVGTRERYRDGAVESSFRDHAYSFAGLLGPRLTPELTVSGGGFVVFGTSEALDDVPGPRDIVFGPATQLRYDDVDFHLFVSEGVRAVVDVRRALETLGAARDASFVDLEASATVLTGWRHAVSAVAVGHARSGDDLLDAHWIGGRRGFRGFPPQTVMTSLAAALSLDYSVPLAFALGGTWTAGAYVDAGFVRDAGIDWFVNPGVGFRFYLRDIALPAVGLDLVLNTQERELVPTAAVGLSF